MHLLIYISSLSSGGAERVVSTLANFWCGRGWNIDIVTAFGRDRDFYDLDPRVRRYVLDDSGLRSRPSGLRANVRRVWRLRKLLLESKPDVALSMMESANVVMAVAALLAQRAAIGSERVHPPAVATSNVWRALRWWCYRYLAAVTALTSESSRWLLENTFARRCPVIPNPVALPMPRVSPLVAPSSVGVAGRRRLLAVGRLDEQKGFDLLVAVFAELSRHHPNWELVIVGEGPLRGSIERQIAAVGLLDRVHLAGRVGNVGDWYAGADAFVLSSRYEGFPNTLVEAMSLGLPSVAFDCETGPRDVIDDGHNGLLVPAGDLGALKTALCRILGDEELRISLGRKALEVADRFSLEKVAAMWERLFVEVRS
ncbi:MAG: glycosyltransferase family 4 protein [Steroidobacteraceae bacterium]